MGKNRKCAVLLFGMVASLLGLVSSSWADFHITPSIALREEYNDNIFLTATDKKDDFITSISPSIHLGYTASILTLNLDYGLDVRLYAKHSDQNLTSLQNTQRAQLGTTVSLYRDIVKLRVQDVYARVPADIRQQAAINNYLVNMTDSNSLTVNPYVEYPITGTLEARLSYQYDNQWYKDSSLSKYQSHTFEVGLTKELTPQLAVSALYDYIITDYTSAMVPDYNRQNARANIRYQVTPRLSLIGSAGETWFDYKDMGSTSSPTWNIGAKYEVTGRLSLSASYEQDYYNPAVGVPLPASYLSSYYSTGTLFPGMPYPADYYANAYGPYKTDTATAGVTYSGNIPVSVQFTYGRNKYTQVVREDKWEGVTISTNKPVTSKITCGVSGLYSHYTYLPENEKADRYGADVHLSYALRITTLELGYVYNRNNSSVGANDYSNNIVYIQARFVL
jgi:hypothetical protein